MEEFFEAFSIKKVRECELRDECFLGFAHTCDKCDVYGQAYEVYPPITSDIVLGLIGILTKKHCNITLYWGLPKLTEQILKQCVRDAKDKEVQAQVRALFNAD